MGHIEAQWRSSITRRKALAGLATFLAGSPLLVRGQQDTAPLRDHRRTPGLSEMLTAFDLEQVFRANLPLAVYDYTAHGAEGEFTMRRNRESFDWVDIVRPLVGNAATVSTATEIMGIKMDFPIFVAPTATQGPLHPDGERGMYAGATAAGTTMMLSSAATESIENVAAHASGSLWYQHYPREDTQGRQEVLERAQSAGCQVVVVTVDQRALYYERDLHDRHLGNAVSTSRPQRPSLGNPYRMTDYWPWITWSYLDEIRPLVKVPMLLKGILTVEDAALAVEHGMDGIVVSNHGGRSVDYAPSTIEILPEIVDAIRGRIPVLVDSGFRRGSDIFKALALGARGVLLGRATRWGLGGFGPAGVQRVLEIIQSELVMAMKDAGRPTLASIDRTAVTRRFL